MPPTVPRAARPAARHEECRPRRVSRHVPKYRRPVIRISLPQSIHDVRPWDVEVPARHRPKGNMTITRTITGEGLPTGLPFSLATSSNSTCFISGMPALAPDGTYQPGTFEEELALAWHNVAQIAAAAGYSAEEIIYVQCVVADIGDYAALNDWWRRQFPDTTAAPARFTFQAAALPFGCKIEIQAVAATGN